MGHFISVTNEFMVFLADRTNCEVQNRFVWKRLFPDNFLQFVFWEVYWTWWESWVVPQWSPQGPLCPLKVHRVHPHEGPPHGHHRAPKGLQNSYYRTWVVLNQKDNAYNCSGFYKIPHTNSVKRFPQKSLNEIPGHTCETWNRDITSRWNHCEISFWISHLNRSIQMIEATGVYTGNKNW